MNETEQVLIDETINKITTDDGMMKTESLFKGLFFVSIVTFVILLFRLIYQLYKKMTSKPNESMLTDSKPFKMMVSSTFKSMDNTGNGEVTKDELYAGLLLIHLKLSKFVGAPACYPPVKETCDSMFHAADHDSSGGIDEGEFSSIMGACCGQIASRMIVYYLIVMLGVPFVAQKCVDILPIEEGSYFEMVTETVVGFIIFSVAIPVVWNYIDESSRRSLEKKDNKAASGSSSNGLTSLKETPKKTN